jgi:hypothetical protein
MEPPPDEAKENPFLAELSPEKVYKSIPSLPNPK